MTAPTSERLQLGERVGRLTRFTAPSRVPRIVGALTYLVALADIATAVARGPWRTRLHSVEHLLPGLSASTSLTANLVVGLLLLPIAHGLRRRKHRAWLLAIILLAVSVIAHGLRIQPVAAVLSAALIVTLVVYRAQFRAAGDPSTRWRAVRAFLGLGSVSVVAGTLLLMARTPHFVVGDPGLGDLVGYVVPGLVGLGSGLTFVSGRAQDAVDTILLSLGVTTMAVTAYLALRSPTPRPQLTDEDDERMRGLLDKAPDSLAYFNLRRDKSVVWSASGKSAVAYRVVNGVILASGDPIGDPEAWPGAIDAFLHRAETYAWTPAVLGCSERGGTVWRRETGFDVWELGDEAVVDTSAFTLSGRSMRNVRQMINRTQRSGYSTQVTRVRDLTAADAARIREDAGRWRGSATERGFSMALGRTADPADPDAVVVTAVKDDVVRGILQFVPWGHDGMSLDLMIRDQDAEGGLNDLMLVAALQAAPALGITRASLNFAAFRSVIERGERLGAGPIDRSTRAVLLFASRWFQIESLYRFNAKFEPHWRPRYLVFPRSGDLARVGLAAMEAEAFITWPTLGRLKGLGL